MYFRFIKLNAAFSSTTPPEIIFFFKKGFLKADSINIFFNSIADKYGKLDHKLAATEETTAVAWDVPDMVVKKPLGIELDIWLPNAAIWIVLFP